MITHSTRHKTVSIGIPAYNEESTIEALLLSLLGQKEEGYSLEEIIVLCDGSTDETAIRAQALRDPRIVVVYDEKRLGKSVRLQEILQRFTGEILFLMDADISITDSQILMKIMKGTHFETTGLVGVAAIPLHAETSFEKIVNCGVSVLNDIANRWNGGNNYLSFKGCFLGMDRKLAKSTTIPSSLVNNDAYFYFKALELGYLPRKLKEVSIYYRSPGTFADHLKQSSRYRSSKKELQQYFSHNLTTAYRIPFHVYVKSTLRSLLKEPIWLASYLFVRLFTKLARDKQVRSTWEVATTTKRLGGRQ